MNPTVGKLLRRVAASGGLARHATASKLIHYQLPQAAPLYRQPYLAFRHASNLRRYSTPAGKIDKPTYQLTFTCKACSRRSSHLVSKQAYHRGTVLIQCPGCKNRHLIADHLNVFGQGKKTLEDILREKGDGETITHRTIDLSKIGDIEWEGPESPPEQHLLAEEGSKEQHK